MVALNVEQNANETTSDQQTPSDAGEGELEATPRSNPTYQVVEKEPSTRYGTHNGPPSHMTTVNPTIRVSNGGVIRTTRVSYFRSKAPQQDLERCTQELEHARIKIALLESERDQLEGNLRKLQARAFQRFDTPGWKPECNDDISRKLNLLEMAAKSWAKNNSIADMHDYRAAQPPSASLKRLNITLSEFIKPNGDMPIMIVPSNKAWVLTQAYVMHRLYLNVFDEPFFGLTTGSDEEESMALNDGQGQEPQNNPENAARKPGEDLSQSLQSLYDDFDACESKRLNQKY